MADEAIRALVERLERADRVLKSLSGDHYAEVPPGKEAADALASYRTRVEELERENTRIRAALAVSDHPCVYCSLSADDWAKCKSGFPGCARADDSMGCPELGASLRADEAESKAGRLAEALGRLYHLCEVDDPFSEPGLVTVRMVRSILYSDDPEAARALAEVKP